MSVTMLRRMPRMDAHRKFVQLMTMLLVILLININDLDHRVTTEAKLIERGGAGLLFNTYECEEVDIVDEDICAVTVTQPPLNETSIVFRSTVTTAVREIYCLRCSLGHLTVDARLMFSVNVTRVQLSDSGVRSMAAGAIAGTFTALDLAFNQLRQLNESRTFRQIPKLESLQMDHNRLVALDERVFDGISHLISLFLHNNELIDLRPRLFARLPKLRSLRLHNNRIEVLDAGLFAANHELAELTLHTNRVAVVAGELWARLHTIAEFDVDNIRNQVAIYGDRDPDDIQRLGSPMDCEMDTFGETFNIDEVFNRSCAELTEIPTDLFRAPLFTHINLRHNLIGRIDGNSFHNTSTPLHSIDLAHNQISSIHPNAFAELLSLRTLLLSHNLIDQLDSRLFANLNDLIRIELHNNRLNTVPTDLFWNTVYLRRLTLHQNRISKVGDNAFDQLHQLDAFDMSHNDLQNVVLISVNAQRIQANAANIQYLALGLRVMHVDASDNSLTSLKLTHTVNLLALNVARNQLATMDLSAQRFLQHVDLSGNRLIFLSFMHNECLLDVDVSDNQLTEIRLPYSSHLQRFDVSRNRLEWLSMPTESFSVSHLNVSHNRLESIESFAALMGLRELDLSDNPLNVLDAELFLNFEILELLIVRDCGLIEIAPDFFRPLAGLQVIDLSYNDLGGVVHGDTFDGLEQLKWMRLNACNVTAIERNLLRYVPRLERIDVFDNAFVCDDLAEFLVNMEKHVVQVVHNADECSWVEEAAMELNGIRWSRASALLVFSMIVLMLI